MSLTLLAPPTTEPLTIAEVQTHLRVDQLNAEPCPRAPFLALQFIGGGNVEVGARRYAVTFVTADGETQGGDVSTSISTTNTATKVILTNLQIGGSAVTARRIYRTLAGGSTFFLLATVSDNVSVGFTDDRSDTTLTDVMPTLNTTQDPYLLRLIRVARIQMEEYTKRAMISQQWSFRAQCWPNFMGLRIPKAPVKSVQSVACIDSDQNVITLDPATYHVRYSDVTTRLLLAYNKLWPQLSTWEYEPIEVTFTAGYGPSASDVPDTLRQAMLLTIGDLYMSREATNIGNIVNALPTWKTMVGPYRIIDMH